jgi:hypothetical protein
LFHSFHLEVKRFPKNKVEKDKILRKTVKVGTCTLFLLAYIMQFNTNKKKKQEKSFEERKRLSIVKKPIKS